MVAALLRARGIHGALSSAAPGHDAPGPGLQVRRGAPADLGAVHRQGDRRREQGQGGAGGGRAAAQGQGARRGGRAAKADPRGQREGQESLSPSVGGGVVELEDTEGLKPSVRKDVQVRILPPLPTSSQSAAYSYLLGMYLGDGYISRTPRTYRLEVSLHKRQGPVIERVASAISALRPGHPVGFRLRESVTIVNAYWNAWPTLFPQHGAGRKHQRPIVLDSWQRSIVEQNPQEFVRGCIESDGCRHRRVGGGAGHPPPPFPDPPNQNPGGLLPAGEPR